jgi:hypothetical protein
MVVTDDVVLAVNRDAAQKVQDTVRRLRQQDRPQAYCIRRCITPGVGIRSSMPFPGNKLDAFGLHRVSGFAQSGMSAGRALGHR